MLKEHFQAQLDAGSAPIDESELKQIENLLKRTKIKRQGLDQLLSSISDNAQTLDDDHEKPPSDIPHIERCRHYGAEFLV